MRYAEALEYLASIEGLGIKLALRNITSVLEALGSPQSRYPSVLVAGSNGKGSVAAMLASILGRAGYRAGLYTSPHLIRYEERIIVDRAPVTEEEFGEAIGRVRAQVSRLLASGELQAHPTHFETVTAAAFDHFARASIDLAVLEVGMGGRLDATVLAGPSLSIVTSIALEHTRYLGDTIAAIAGEKAGILPRGGLLLVGERDPEALEVFRARAREMEGRLVELDEYARVGTSDEAHPAVATPSRRLPDLEIGLPGEHQVRNAALAVAACDHLEEAGFSIPDEAVREGLRDPGWPGRFQVLPGRPRVIFDGAHNPAGCRAFRETLASAGASPATTTLLFGALRDKDHAGMLEILAPAAGRLVLTRGVSPRFREPHELAALSGREGPDLRVTDTAQEGLEVARELTPGDGVLAVCGSLYLVGDLMRLLGVEPWPSSRSRSG